jgi:ABC-type polar amino acid transport system ATPase subunit
VADRVVFMDNGKIVEEGEPDRMFDNPESERLGSFLQAVI